jgi:GT2 family glycosyltransferase
MDYICDIIMLTWNQLEVTKKCIESFLENTKVACRLIVIDNASTDGTAGYLSSLRQTNLIKITVVLNKENKGFVGGMNQGIEMSSAPYLCLANNDLIFTDGWLAEVLSIFEKYNGVGVINPHSNNLGRRLPRGMTVQDYAEVLHNKFKGVFVEMPFCIGFCMVIKREVIDKVGGLSEEFAPMFFEDSDYSLKAAKEGFLIGVSKGSYVWHKEHASLDSYGKEKEAVFKKSKKIFERKWGEVKRIAWIEDNYQEIPKNMDKALKIARQGNRIEFLIKNHKGEAKEAFKNNNDIKHSAIKFTSWRNKIGLIWKILKKKKKYHLIITRHSGLTKFFKSLKYKVEAN